MKKFLFSILTLVAVSQANASPQVMSEVDLPSTTVRAEVHYARWNNKYPIEYKEVKCNPMPDSDLNTNCMVVSKVAPRLVVTLKVDRGAFAEVEYKDIVLNPSDMQPTKQRLEKLFTVNLIISKTVGPIERTFCQGEGSQEQCETETYMGEITSARAQLVRK